MPKRKQYELGSFDALSVTELSATAIIAQCLDNQWAPSAFLKSLSTLGRCASIDDIQSRLLVWRYGSVSLSLKHHVRHEYIRSLIAAEQVVINRAYLLNTQVIYTDAELTSGNLENRKAFVSFISDGVIVPFLFKEEISADIGEVDPEKWDAIGAQLWKSVCSEATPQCVRLSWDEAENSSIIDQVTADFHNRVASLSAHNPERILKNLRGLESAIDPDEAQDFRKHLVHLNREILNIQDFEGRNASRFDVYERFIIASSTRPDQRIYDGRQPFLVETKQLVDLAYNTNLSDKLQVMTLTPQDSPTRLALCEETRFPRQHEELDPSSFAQTMKDIRFSLIQRTIHFIDFSQLTLADVFQIRKMDAWIDYNKAVEAIVLNTELLQSTENFMSSHNGLMRLEDTYADLFSEISRRYQRAVIRKGLKVASRISVQVAGEYIVAIWASGIRPFIQFSVNWASEKALAGISERTSEVVTGLSFGWLAENSTDFVGAINLHLSRNRFSNARAAYRELTGEMHKEFSTYTDDVVDTETATMNRELEGAV